MLNEMRSHLVEKLLPFWAGLKDDENGGYFGQYTFDLQVNKHAEKGCILNSRILWFFSKAYLLLGDKSILPYATHAYKNMMEKFVDDDFLGVYWSITAEGTPLDTTKHTYNQAFSIYALSAYYQATKDEKALEKAFAIYHLIEEKCKDENGYLESFNREFLPESNEKLSENGVVAHRTMNTLLHVIEAYGGLYEVTRDGEVGASITKCLHIFKDKMYNKAECRQEVFFDSDYHSLLDLCSYGHDIESCWLLEWAASLLDDAPLFEEISAISSQMAKHVYDNAFISDSLLNECEDGVKDTTRVWWVQAEAVVGFLNEWQKNNAQRNYLDAANRIWSFIKTYMVDSRPHSEWFWEVDATFAPTSKKDIVEPWKCPYHNGRMCMEIMKRLG